MLVIDWLFVDMPWLGTLFMDFKMQLQDWQKEFEEMKRQKEEAEKNLWKSQMFSQNKVPFLQHPGMCYTRWR